MSRDDGLLTFAIGMMCEATGLHEAPALPLLARRPPQAGQADASARQGQSITAPLCAACGPLWIGWGCRSRAAIRGLFLHFTPQARAFHRLRCKQDADLDHKGFDDGRGDRTCAAHHSSIFCKWGGMWGEIKKRHVWRLIYGVLADRASAGFEFSDVSYSS